MGRRGNSGRTKLPDKVVSINSLRIVRDKKKKCTCGGYGGYRAFEIDTKNKEVLCVKCGAVVQPYDAICELADYYERLQADVKSLLEQRKQILNYKPHLLDIRKLERTYRGGTMLPACPHCGRGIQANEFNVSVNKEMELERRKFEGKKLIYDI
jgi:hypothetical protein